MKHEATKNLETIMLDIRARKRALESIVYSYIGDTEIPTNERFKSFMDSEVGEVSGNPSTAVAFTTFASGVYATNDGRIHNAIVNAIAGEGIRRGYDVTRPMVANAIVSLMDRIAGIPIHIPNNTPQEEGQIRMPRVAVINPTMVSNFKEECLRRAYRQLTLGQRTN